MRQSSDRHCRAVKFPVDECENIGMATPEPTHRWYQYSLRLLLLLFVVVALLCSLGVCTHWLVSAVLGSAMLIGGIAGRVR